MQLLQLLLALAAARLAERPFSALARVLKEPNATYESATGLAPTVADDTPAPEAAEAAAVSEPPGAEAIDEIVDSRYVNAMKHAFVLQFVHVQEENPGQVRDSLDPSENNCLTLSAPDTLGGRGLSFSECYTADTPTRNVSLEQQWFLMPDGKITSAVNSTTDPLCLRETRCLGVPAFDVASCKRIDATEFAVTGTVRNRMDTLQKIGRPINAVIGPGQTHGPFQLYPICEGVQKKDGCVTKAPRSGWTKQPNQFLGPNQYVEGGEFSWFHVVSDMFSGDSGWVDEVQEGIQAAREDVVETGLSMSDAGTQCATSVASNDRSVSWWYFLRL
jgi:hypothetical protein